MELKLPPAGTPDYTWAEYRQEVEAGTYPGPAGSFCRTFMEATDEYNAAHDEWKSVTEAWNRAYFEHRL